MSGNPVRAIADEPTDRGQPTHVALDDAPTSGTVSGPTLRRTVVIANPQGLHMRPAAAVAKAAQQFQSRVTIRMGDRAVDGKSVFDMLLLAAECGAALELEVSGCDAPVALETLGDALALPAMNDE